MKKIGLVGLGFIGNIHLQAYEQMEHAEVKSIFTKHVSEEETLTTAKFVNSIEELLQDEEIDIIDICLPTHLHEEYIIKAANAGKHIFCEKPLTLTVESAERIEEAVERNRVRLFVGHILRFWPEYQTIKLLSQTSQLHKITSIHAERLGRVPVGGGKWIQESASNGDTLLNLHIHDLDLVCSLLGEVASIYSVGHRNEQGEWNHLMTTLTFSNHSHAMVEASQQLPIGYPATLNFRIQTPERAVEFRVEGDREEETDNFIYYYNKKKFKMPIEKADAFQSELAYFVHCLETNEANEMIPLEEVLYNIRLLQAIENSLESRQVVAF